MECAAPRSRPTARLGSSGTATAASTVRARTVTAPTTTSAPRCPRETGRRGQGQAATIERLGGGVKDRRELSRDWAEGSRTGGNYRERLGTESTMEIVSIARL